jgi:hypothetical protein
MAASVHRPLKVIAFNANGIWRRPYELSKQLKDRCGSALTDISQTSREVLYSKLSFLSD